MAKNQTNEATVYPPSLNSSLSEQYTNEWHSTWTCPNNISKLSCCRLCSVDAPSFQPSIAPSSAPSIKPYLRNLIRSVCNIKLEEDEYED